MITGLESAILGLGAYSLIGAAYAFAQKERWAKEIGRFHGPTTLLELYCYKTIHTPPAYIGSGNTIHAMIPVGGGSQEEKVFITSRIAGAADYKHLGYDTSILPMTSYAYSSKALQPDAKKHNINLNQYRFSFPIECKKYKYPNGAFYHKGIGYVAGSREALLGEVIWRKRLPLTVTAVSCALMLFAGTWTIWGFAGGREIYKWYDQWYPPFWFGKRRRIN